jgi:malto-oligosyltrehalose trehalohydrolase
MRRRHELFCGAEPGPQGVRFRLWAPRAKTVALRLETAAPREIAMVREEEGWFSLTTAAARPGDRYRYLVDGRPYPDPASRFQPEGVHGASEIVDPEAYVWNDSGWRGRKWEEIVLYELHVGTFSPSGDFAGVVGRLDHIRALGATAIELMPVAAFPGSRNWGYDGVYLYAPAACYGRPEQLKRLVEACHHCGLAVFLDVVYNHFGPEGNYLPAIAPDFFAAGRHTPWGAALDYSSRPVRDFIIHNALYWLEEFHFDGLRLDAVHAIVDERTPDLLDELAEHVRRRLRGREVRLVLENDRNEVRRLERRDDGGPRYTAQWNDDVHHALHVLISGETAGHYADFAQRPAAHLARALAEGFAYQGEPSPFRRGRRRGAPSAGLPATAFVAYLQNHDQIGNTPFGTRLAARLPAAVLHAGLAIILLSPQIPLLFMGEEWASRRAFPFFCDFEPALARQVCEGRRREFAHFPDFAEAAARARIPDPGAVETFLAARLDWEEPDRPPHRCWLARCRRLLAIRAREIVPRLAGIGGFAGRYDLLDERAIRVEWRLGDGSRLVLLANFAAQPAALSESLDDARLIYASAAFAAAAIAPHSAAFLLRPPAAAAGPP